MSKKCTNCGTELKEKAKFCPVCGTAVPEEINEVVKPKLARKKIAMAVVAGAVLVGGGFAVYGKIGAKSSQQKEPVKVENSTKRMRLQKQNKRNRKNRKRRNGILQISMDGTTGN
ncbi:MAG: zinc-ribbon domain-containing protein [Mediterraneibacter faecis]